MVFARGAAEAADIIEDFKRREISDVLFQRHIEGDLIKFYGVGPGQWFTWFYHDPQTARRLAFELEDLAAQAETAARSVNLEVFGGDAIVSPDGLPPTSAGTSVPSIGESTVIVAAGWPGMTT